MTLPVLAGIHHLKLPVSDLDASLAWYRRVLGAVHLPQFDHVDDDGQRYAVIVAIPGVELSLELRWAPAAAGAIGGYDPINFAASSVAELRSWADHLDAERVRHSGVIEGGAGHLLVVADPDGTFLRISELPAGGVENIVMPRGNPEPDDPWLSPPLMTHPSIC
jgi:catechol 2,3-dioxygenase-like lactoylglutathione lyase family enzyme